MIPATLFNQPGFAVLLNPGSKTDTIRIFLNPLRKIPFNAITGDLPIAGFVTYEHAHSIEQFSAPSRDVYQLPPSCFYEYQKVISIDDRETTTYLSPSTQQPLWAASEADIASLMRCLRERPLPPAAPTPLDYEEYLSLCQKYSNFTQHRYQEAVSGVRNLIERGEVYQANLSQQITIPRSFDPWKVFIDLLSIEHGSYSAFFSVGSPDSPKHIISNSPELFYSRSRDVLKVCPIKGTAARVTDPLLDTQARDALLASEKNRAELAMIVDLLRNDLGKIAKPGTIHVQEFPKLFSLQKVHHLCAPIEGVLSHDYTPYEIFNALFPSGSVTGAPKIAAMEYISQFEKTARGIYCGSIGWCHAGNEVWNVAIRTGVMTADALVFQAGGGITFDSEPEAEYRETLDKAASFIQVSTK